MNWLRLGVVICVATVACFNAIMAMRYGKERSRLNSKVQTIVERNAQASKKPVQPYCPPGYICTTAGSKLAIATIKMCVAYCLCCMLYIGYIGTDKNDVCESSPIIPPPTSPPTPVDDEAVPAPSP